ncbi:hypothetical protein HHL24_42925 [Paraburkholderia sp. RP-4-7]|uniref:Uncharacterized protein n=1 Tax=Paraburkholderia polaris TaxID=2728848 RepID=A0A848IQN8_9BURK|nr:hypothetical protein [Paraburkholderia polaris]NMM04572.1 hypothetical protein [Paraburkholderia polaris]
MSDLTLPSVNAADSAASPIGQAKRQWRTLVACSIGNALEMYGSAVYMFFATSIGRLFFPADNLDETLGYRVADPTRLSTLVSGHGSKFVRGVLSIVAHTVGMVLVVFFMPTYLVRVRHLPTSLSLVTGFVSDTTMSVMRLVSGRLVRRIVSCKPIALTNMAHLYRAHIYRLLANESASGFSARACDNGHPYRSQQLVWRTVAPVADGNVSRWRVRQRAVRDLKHRRRAVRRLRAAHRLLVALQDGQSAVACDLHARMLSRHRLRDGPLHERGKRAVCKLDGDIP